MVGAPETTKRCSHPVPLNKAHASCTAFISARTYDCVMAIEVEVQRLELGDVVLVHLPDQDAEVEAMVVRGIDRTESTVRATLRVPGRDDFIKEWALDDLITIVRGP